MCVCMYIIYIWLCAYVYVYIYICQCINMCVGLQSGKHATNLSIVLST